MEVHHDEAQKKFWVEVDGYKADMSYHLKEGHLDIRHTLVPEAFGYPAYLGSGSNWRQGDSLDVGENRIRLCPP